MKNILHLQVDFSTDKVISPELLGKFVGLCQKKLGDDFVAIASTTEPSMVSEEHRLYNFNMKQISLEELNSMIGE